MLQQFHRMNSVIVKISPANIEKVKSSKPDYPSILSHLLNLALNDSDLLKNVSKTIRKKVPGCLPGTFSYNSAIIT